MIKPLILIITYKPSNQFFTNNLNLIKYRYLIVDNTSNLNLEFINQIKQYENVDLICNQANLGIAKALNIGCQYALNHGYTHVITMDQDSVLSEDIIAGLCDYYQSCEIQDKIAVLSPAHVNQDGSYANGMGVPDGVYDSIFCMTSGNLLSLKHWQLLHGFNENFFIDMVDMEYYIRAFKAGFIIRTLGWVKLSHSLGNVKNYQFLWRNVRVLNHNYIRKYYQVRNTLWLRKQYSDEFPEINFFNRLVLHLCIKALLYEDDKLRKVYYMLKGYWDYLRNNFKPLECVN